MQQFIKKKWQQNQLYLRRHMMDSENHVLNYCNRSNIQGIIGNHGALTRFGLQNEQKKVISDDELIQKTMPSNSQVKSFKHDIIDSKADKEDETNMPPATKKKGVPTGIVNTEPGKEKLHFGSIFTHTLKSSGGSLRGIKITEKVTHVKDDFRTGKPGVEIGKNIGEVNHLNQISDKILITYGYISPALERLRKDKNPDKSLIGSSISHQELFYKENPNSPKWTKFMNVKIVQLLYDMGQLFVATIHNEVPAEIEKYAIMPPTDRDK